MSHRFGPFLILMSALVLQACNPSDSGSDGSASTANETPQAKIFHFLESEPGIDPYPVRMVVTAGYLRMDEGNATDNFLLFDRQSNTIHSVNHEDKTVLRMPRRDLPSEVPESVSLEERAIETEGMPDFAGKKPVHTSYFAGDKNCYDAVAVAGFEPDAVDAIREYLLTLSGEQLQNLNKTPPEMRSECMMANLIYAPVRHLKGGFPLREWDYKGYLRELVNMESEAVEPSLFELDPTYRIYELSASGLPALVN